MFKNLQVYYRVEQQAGDVSPVVYISQVRSTCFLVELYEITA